LKLVIEIHARDKSTIKPQKSTWLHSINPEATVLQLLPGFNRFGFGVVLTYEGFGASVNNAPRQQIAESTGKNSVAHGLVLNDGVVVEASVLHGQGADQATEDAMRVAAAKCERWPRWALGGPWRTQAMQLASASWLSMGSPIRSRSTSLSRW